MNQADIALTTAEVSALLRMPERKVRKEIEHRIFEVDSPPRLHLDALVYLQALSDLDTLEPSVEGRRRFFIQIRTALASQSPPASEIGLGAEGKAFRFRLKEVVDAVWERLETFERWKLDRVGSDPQILAGEPVIKGTRLSVRHIGELAAKTPVDEILSDYPYLTSDDVLFSSQYAQAYPRTGRPRESA